MTLQLRQRGTTARVERLKEEIFNRQGTFFERTLLYAEAYRGSEDEFRPEAREAKALKHLLEHIAVAIGDDELIVGRHPRREPTHEEEKAVEEASAYLRSQPAAVVGGWEGHMALNNERLLAEGLDGIRERVWEKLASLDPADRPADVERESFYRGALLALDALTAFILRYADEAARLKEEETTDPVRAEELARIVAICRRIAHEPPTTFYEALQLCWFVHLVVCAESSSFHACFCPGRFDQYVYPYYRRDLEFGRITPDEAQELVDCYLLKLNEFGIRTQAIQLLMIGGQTRAGEDGANDISFMVLDAFDRLRIREPSLALSWHSNLSDELMTRACELLADGLTYPSIFNDEVIVPGLVRAGVDQADAYHYNPGSCVEITVCGRSKSFYVSHYVNLPLWLLFTMWNGADPRTGETCGLETGPAEAFGSFDDFLGAYKCQMAHMLRENAITVNRQQALLRRYKSRPLCSCFVDDCLEKGVDIEKGGARYVFTEPQGVGVSTVVDSLIAIKKLVYEERALTLEGFRDILAEDFEGHEGLRLQIINRLPKYGTDNGEADALAVEIVEHFCKEVESHTPLAGGRYHPGFLGYRVYYDFGLQTPATPDGRKSGQALSDSMGPSQGRGTAGPTAAIKSATKFDHTRILGGLVLNLKFSPISVRGEEGVRKLKELLTTYLKRGGFEAQVNVIGEETLRAAQREPDKYRDLIVRVGGYSAYFTDLPRTQQDEIISRSTY